MARVCLNTSGVAGYGPVETGSIRRYEVCGWWWFHRAGLCLPRTLRLRAADLFAHDVDPVEVARQLWRAGGETALVPPGGGRLSDRQLGRLRVRRR